MDYDTYSANDAIGKGKHTIHSIISQLGPVITFIDIINLIWDNFTFLLVYINLNPLLISHGTSHQSASVSGAIVGIQNEQDHTSGNTGDISNTGDSGLIMGAPINTSNLGNAVPGDDSAIITPTWLKTSSR